MNAHTKITAANVQANIAERNVVRAAQIAELGQRATQLASIMWLNLKPTNSRLLWAEWYFAKAQHDWAGDDTSLDAFQAACDNLNVDHDGNSNDDVRDADGTVWGGVS